MHGILAFKSLAPADPAAYIPSAHRGILGTLTPELLGKLRETIRCHP